MLKRNSAYCYKLNETAGFLWEQLDRPKGSKDLAKLIFKNYNVEELVAERDVEDFLKQGIKHGFLFSSRSG